MKPATPPPLPISVSESEGKTQRMVNALAALCGRPLGEILQTLVVRFPIEEVSMKERMGGPIDDEEDHALETWAGTIPLRLVPGEPVDDAIVKPRAPVPEHAQKYRRPSAIS